MKKIRISILSLLLLTALLSVSLAPAFAEDAYAPAFSGQGTLRLVPYTPECLTPEVLADESFESVLSISPDGKTVLGVVSETETMELIFDDPTENEEKEGEKEEEKEKETTLPGRNPLSQRSKKKTDTTPPGEPVTVERTVYHFCLIRDGKIVPVRENAERGNGDPYGNMETVTSHISVYHYPGDISWSADGRYFTFSDVQRTVTNYAWMLNYVLVADTAEGELYMADSYVKRNTLVENNGVVYLSRMSRDGAYIYYLVRRNMDDGIWFCFCRCRPDGRDREILCRTESDGRNMAYRPVTVSDLIENPDGSWTLFGTDEPLSYSSREHNLVMVSFVPSGDTWTADVRSTGVTGRMTPVDYAYSPDSGYGLILLFYSETMPLYRTDSPDSADGGMGTVGRRIGEHIRIIRIRPDPEKPFDVWYLHRTGEQPEDVEILSGKASLEYLQARIAGENPEKPAELAGSEEGRYEPYFRTYPIIYGACVSPDGRYALVKVLQADWSGESQDRILQYYLLDLETMALVPVEAPGAVAGKEDTSSYSAKTTRNRSDMVWNPDGTIFIPGAKEKTGDVFFRLEAAQ